MEDKTITESISSFDFKVSIFDYGDHNAPLSSTANADLALLCSSNFSEIFSIFLKNSSSFDTLDSLLQKAVKSYLDEKCNTSFQQMEVLNVGVACLRLFVQSNWTGPSLPVTLPIPCLECLAGKEEEVTTCLTLDGESCCSVMRHPLLLLFARALLSNCAEQLSLIPSSKWWWQRCLFVHQQVLDEFSPTIHTALKNLLKEALEKEPVVQDPRSWILFHLEAAQICLYYSEVVHSKTHVESALDLANMKLALVGALGKRTRFQEKQLAQLMVKVSVSRNDDVIPSVDTKHLPKDLSLDDEVRLNQIKFANEDDGKFPALLPLEQAVVLATLIQTQKSQPKDGLANEELLPYISCILSRPQSWSLQMSALFLRCRLDSSGSRTVERAMMQAQTLVDSIDAAMPSAPDRLSHLFVSHLPPRWEVEAELADLFIHLGAINSALDIYLRLEKWEEVISCYTLLKLRHKAAEVIRQELEKKETVKMLCLLGDATDDVSCYEKAWELSKHKSGRAQRHWAQYHFARKEYAESIPHFSKSLSINSLQVTLWLRLGFACLDTENWELCATAYRRYCVLDSENFEAWNNLAKAYVKLGQKPRAWRALQEAVKCNFENWRVWDNILAVGMDCGEFSEVIEAYHHLLDLKEKHVDTEVLQILVQAVTRDILDSQGVPAGRLRAKLLTLFGRLTSQVTNNSKVWWLYSQLTASQDEKTHSILQLTVQYLQKAQRSAVQDAHWVQDTAKCKTVMDISISLVDG
uniref:Tetratricopeptide repeat protein 27 n=1 Tax=Timema shepardi TaxID=629360 RepID=A0A7R9APP4_TIMSH|nr:unnamed protein product [Timema shepardi]